MESCKQFIERKNEQFSEDLNNPKKAICTKDIGRKGRHCFVREAWMFMPQSNLEEKVFLIERLRKVKIEGLTAHPKATQVGEIEYRIGYFMVGKNGRSNGHWIWGQFCPLIPRKDFARLFEKAKDKGVIL